MSTMGELKAKKAALVAALKTTDAAIQAEERRIFLGKLHDAKRDGKLSRWFLVWFGYSMMTVRTKTAMTVEQLNCMMDPAAVKSRESLHGPMTIEAVSKSRFYSVA